MSSDVVGWRSLGGGNWNDGTGEGWLSPINHRSNDEMVQEHVE